MSPPIFHNQNHIDISFFSGPGFYFFVVPTSESKSFLYLSFLDLVFIFLYLQVHSGSLLESMVLVSLSNSLDWNIVFSFVIQVWLYDKWLRNSLSIFVFLQWQSPFCKRLMVRRELGKPKDGTLGKHWTWNTELAKSWFQPVILKSQNEQI